MISPDEYIEKLCCPSCGFNNFYSSPVNMVDRIKIRYRDDGKLYFDIVSTEMVDTFNTYRVYCEYCDAEVYLNEDSSAVIIEDE